jgi:hypothetical protein
MVKMLKYGVLAVFILLRVSGHCQIYSVLSSWETKKQSKDILLQYRWINYYDTLKIRQTRIILFIEAGIPDILGYFTQAKTFSLWAAGVKQCAIDSLNPEEWVTYTNLDIPWPFEQKDMVARYKIINYSDEVILSITSSPDHLPRRIGVSRIETYYGQWIFKRGEDQKTYVEFYTIALDKPIMPRFVQDPVIQQVLLDSVYKLKMLSESNSG